MEISKNTRQAYSEVYEFLSLLKVEEKNKIPKELLEFFDKERDFNYKKVGSCTNFMGLVPAHVK